MNVSIRVPSSVQPSDMRENKPRLAIVSTYDDLCGIAGYTRSLIRQLENDFEIEVYDLDQFFMRSTNSDIRLLADKMIHDFCKRLKSFDFVNIQLEHGTLGGRQIDVIRRFQWIANAAPALSVTFHTILPSQSLDIANIFHSIIRLKLVSAGNKFFGHRRASRMQRGINGHLRKLSKTKPVNVIVHTRRDMRVMRYVHGLPNVFDHPLSFISQDKAAEIRASTPRTHIPALARLPEDTKVIGVFGFLSEYKGFDVVVRALHLLPENYHLFFFGGVHPNEIRRNEKIYPYVETLLKEANVGKTLLDVAGRSNVSMSVDSANAGMLLDHPKYIGERLHFLGAQTDEDFARGMALCDLVVLPYVETGQSSSGPMSLALEMGCRIIAARNHAFMQFARYHPEKIELFEIGNHLELADRLLSPAPGRVRDRTLKFNTNTNREVYLSANSKKGARNVVAVER